MLYLLCTPKLEKNLRPGAGNISTSGCSGTVYRNLSQLVRCSLVLITAAQDLVGGSLYTIVEWVSVSINDLRGFQQTYLLFYRFGSDADLRYMFL
jgi:hypothetical protein